MATNTNIRFEDREAKQMKDPEFRAAVEKEFISQIIIDPDGDEFHAYCPALKGLHTCGETEQEALENAKDAVIAYLRSLIKHGDPVPAGKRNNMSQKTLMEKILMEMPKDPIKACPVRLCRGGLLWSEAIGDFGCKCLACGGWGFVHDEAAEQTAKDNAK